MSVFFVFMGDVVFVIDVGKMGMVFVIFLMMISVLESLFGN